jgi:aspartyl-tRNA(Asn)/glutamyl-tRNA(Gln) amidotransferase subunit A
MIDKKYSEIKKALNDAQLTSVDLCTAYIKRIEETNPKISAFLNFDKTKILKQAEESDKRRAEKKQLSEFDGIPIGIKDNICIQGERTSSGSKILENFVSPYNATVIENLLAHGFILFPGLNMDEFAMGSSTENSAFGITKNPFDTSRIPGGSSGGSAAAVAASMLPISLGSDTGGSIRQPASLCGIFGLKPSYGRVSRYGLVAYASSLDQIGPFSNDAEGIIDLMHILSGSDIKDSTSSTVQRFSQSEISDVDFSKLKIGIMANEGAEWDSEVREKFLQTIQLLKKKGAEIRELDFSIHAYSIPIYYIIATAECSSNLSRFDGVRYGHRVESPKKLEELYIESRSEGFGEEVKRRILLGTFSLSAGYYDAYYGQAQKARVLIKRSYEKMFSEVDFILQPTSPTTAFKIGEKTKDPVQMYKADIMTTSVNLAGLPAISIPCGIDSKNLPIGLQITANKFEEGKLLSFIREFSKFSEMKIKLPTEIK